METAGHPESGKRSGFPILTTVAVVAYSIIPVGFLFLRPEYRDLYEQMELSQKLPLPTQFLLFIPTPVVCLVLLTINVGLLWANWKGPPKMSKKLNIGALALLILFVHGVVLGIFMPIIKIQQALDGK